MMAKEYASSPPAQPAHHIRIRLVAVCRLLEITAGIFSSKKIKNILIPKELRHINGHIIQKSIVLFRMLIQVICVLVIIFASRRKQPSIEPPFQGS
jgi:hypothetical protein